MKIQADLHTHTVASTHAYSTILENCRFAKEYGLKAIAMTDHAMNMPDAPHKWHFENLRILPRKISDVIVLKGVEADILNENAELDVDKHLLKTMEWVVVSMHSATFPPKDSDAHTRAYLKLCENECVDVIGHCTTVSFPFDMEKCVKKFKEYEKLVEINESSILSGRSSKANAAELIRLCKKYEVPIVCDTDAHYCELIGQTQTCFNLVEDAGFPKELIYNLEWEKIREHIIKKHGDIGI